MPSIIHRLTLAVALCAALAISGEAQAQTPQKVLFVGISGTSYNGDGVNFFNTVAAAAGAGNATYVLLSGSGGQVVSALASGTYQQLWVYDLSSSADNYPADYDAIAAWYNAHASKHVICDGRIISSYWNNRYLDEGARLAANYYYNLSQRQGGIVLTTDHNDFHILGVNNITSRIGLNPFFGNFSVTKIPVDTANVLMTTPNNMGTELWDDSSPGQTPFGLQPNGKILHTLAWHSNNVNTPGISTTIQGALGVQTTINAPADASLSCEPTLTLTASATNGVAPFSFVWSSSLQGSLGSGASITLQRSNLTLGNHVFRVLTTDSQSQVDDATVTVTIGTQAQCAPVMGCGDATREGFSSLATYPAIASCGGAWTDPGVFKDEPACDREAGNTGSNQLGTGCNIEDLCAPGWHVCYGPDDIAVRTTGRGCLDAVASNYPSNGTGPLSRPVPPGGAFFVTRTSGSGFGNCDEVVNGLPSSFNNLFGCGNMGAAPASNCAPLNQFSNQQCLSLQGNGATSASAYGYTSTEWAWECNDGGGGFFESQFAVKSRPLNQGGAMCCKDSSAGLPEVCDGVDNDADGVADEIDFYNDGSANDRPGDACTVANGPGAIACTGPGGWTCKPLAIDLVAPSGMVVGPISPSGTAVAPNGATVTVRITGGGVTTTCTAIVDDGQWACAPQTGLGNGHYTLEATVVVGQGSAKDAGTAEIAACVPGNLPNAGCDSQAPYCTPVGGVWTCVGCQDTGSGVDAGCNAEAPACDSATGTCEGCGLQSGISCGAVDEVCEVPDGTPVPVDQTCLLPATLGQLDPVIEWQRQVFTQFPTFIQIMMTPVAGNLTDDNADARIDGDDVPDIVFTTFAGGAYASPGVLRVIAGNGGAEIFATDGSAVAATPHGSGGVALGDLDGNDRPEIVVALMGAEAIGVWEANVPGQTPAFVFKWKSSVCGAGAAVYSNPAIADVDGDGSAEIIWPGPCVVRADGTLYAKVASPTLAQNAPFAIDLDDDASLEIVSGSSIWELPASGTTLVLKHNLLNDTVRSYAAVGDFDGDGRPEIVTVDSVNARVRLFDPDGATDADTKDGWDVALPDGGSGARGGPPTVADFDGDGELEIGVAAQISYSVLDNNGTTLWTMPVQDGSSRVTGSSVFDFDGDLKAEVVYADEQTLWVFDGKTGTTRASFGGHASGTLYEYPIILDVDHDGQSEIVLASNNYGIAGWTGITVIGSATASWAPARPVWNQHAYNIANIDDDLGVPAVAVKNWTKWNNFRAAAPLEGLAGNQPDLFVASGQGCVGGCSESSPEVLVQVLVGNRGRLDVSVVQIDLRAGGPSGPIVTSVQGLGPASGASREVIVPVTLAQWGSDSLWAEVKSLDDAEECALANNFVNVGFAPVVPDRDEDQIPDTCDPCVTQGDEVCDGEDDDCDGTTDEGCDDDGDGWCDAAIGCDGEASTIVCPNGCGDCADTAGDQWPGALCDGADSDLCNDGSIICLDSGAACRDVGPDRVEACNDLDDDCDDETDEGCDDDGDGWCDVALECTQSAACPNGCGDCDAGDGTVSPGADEVCNGVDDDCDGSSDETPVDVGQSCDGDTDSDECQDGTWVCNDGVRSCDDVGPDRVEACNVIDDDCDGTSDEGCDDDGDGFCDDTMDCTASLQCPRGCGDCDDGNGQSSPQGVEVCNGDDDDCDGTPDDIAPRATTCGIGRCQANGTIVCAQGSEATLCTPNQPLPSDTTCNGVDDNCNGGSDEGYVPQPVSCDQCRSALTTSCVAGQQVTPPCLPTDEGEVCDGGPCASAATCAAGSCTVTRIISCNDDNPCTADSCDPDTGCVAVALEDGTQCGDGDLCTAGDQCSDGACVGAEIECGPPRECETSGSCNGATGVCDYPFTNGCVLCADDQTAPDLVCPVPQLDVECTTGGTLVTLGEASARDACSAVTVDDDRPATFPRGLTQVTFTGRDAAGNEATCTSSVEVVDTQPPTIVCPQPLTVAGDTQACSAEVTFDPTVSDACGGTVEVVASGGPVFPGGTTEVHLTAVDAAGNQASCTTSVTVTGLDAFAITCEPELRVVAPADFCGYPDAVTADLVDQCQGGLTLESSADSFPLGESIVEFTADRLDGATATCTTKVIVTDALAPTVDCGTPDGLVALHATFTPTAADICGVELTIEDAHCERVVGGTRTPETERCQVEVREGRVVFVSDAPASEAGEMHVVYGLVATDPSGNVTELDCDVHVDPEGLDHDGDGLIDREDNCPAGRNADQADQDVDGIGDLCDDILAVEAEGSGGCSGGPLPWALSLLALVLVSRRRRPSNA